MSPFSLATRAADLVEMARAPLDLLVVGGGITGAGVARDAAMRGLRVGVVERRDLACGTSSRSSKLIHGGVRYLQQGDIGLVLEAAEERRILRRTAPHLTQPRPMLIPAFGVGTYTKLNVGLWGYEKLAKIPASERHEMLDRDEALRREPGLRREGLSGAAVYPENVTDDARLVLVNLQSARRAGALVATYAEVAGLSRDGDALVARVRDVEGGAELAVRAKVAVNAAGPWSDAVRSLFGDAAAVQRLHLTKGIHFVVSREQLPIRNMVVSQTSDKRQVFAVPRGDVVYVGTTDTDYGAVADYPEITRDDVVYLIDGMRRSLPDIDWGPERVLAAWAGLRPLLHEEGKRPSEISRKDEVTVDPNGMITVAGGKLTTYRNMAEKVVDLAIERLGTGARRSATREAPLEGGDLPAGRTPESHSSDLLARYAAKLPGLDGAVERIVMFHGSAAEELLERATTDGMGFLDGRGVLAAEVDRAVEGEMALHLTDVLERRLRSLLFDPGRGLGIIEAVAARMARLLEWSPERERRELEEYRRVAEACTPR